MTTDKLKQEIARWETKLADLDQRATQEAGTITRIEEERKHFILAAVAENNSGARKELNRPDLELAGSRQAAADLGTAREQLREKLTGLKAGLAASTRADNLSELEKRNANWLRVCEVLQDTVVKALLPVGRELESCAQEMAELHRVLGWSEQQVTDRYFNTPLAYVAFMLEKNFRSMDGQLGVHGAGNRGWPAYSTSNARLTRDASKFLTNYCQQIIERRVATPAEMATVPTSPEAA